MGALGTALGSAFQSAVGLIKRTPESLSIFRGIVPAFLANLLWILDRRFFTLAKEGFASNAIVYAVLRTLYTAVPEPPLVPYTQDGDGILKKLPNNHALSMLIKFPTPGLLTQYEFWELAVIHLGIAGRHTSFIERANNGAPIGLWPLRPDRVGPIYSIMDEDEARVLKGWSYQVPGTSRYVAIPREDVFFINFPDPAGESGGLVEGLGPLQALAVEVAADNEASKLVGSLLANYATPSLAIKTQTPLPNKEAADLIKNGWMQQFGGVRRGEPAILDAGSDVTPISFSLDKLEFPALRDITESRVAAAFGVPAVLAGLKTGIDRAADANLDGLRLYFAETTLTNYWRRFEDAFTNQVAVWWGDTVVCQFDRRQVRALSVQTRQEKQPIADGFALGAVMIDEYREHVLNLDPLPNGMGQVFMVPSSLIPTLDPHTMAMLPPPAEPAVGSGTGSAAPNPESKSARLDAIQQAAIQRLAKPPVLRQDVRRDDRGMLLGVVSRFDEETAA